MRRFLMFFALVGTFLFCAGISPYTYQAFSIEEEVSIEKAQALSKAFMGKLKTHLQEAMAEGGPEAVLTVCNEKAPEIAAKMSADTGWEIGRRSLKPRNPDNAPNIWEQEILEQFETRKAEGELLETLEYAKFFDEEFRYMKAIPTGGMCVTCHGAKEDIDPDLLTKIETLYPEDLATGYQPGDLRGAFTLKKKLQMIFE